MPLWLATSFQDSASSSMQHILFFNDHSLIILILITAMTIYIMISMVAMKNFNKFLTEGQEIETIWTILPALLLVFIAFPSLKTLYLMEDTKKPDLTVKIMGHQWYWSYEYPSFSNNQLESFMEESKIFRLLKSNAILEVPVMTPTRCLISSSDVIHSWTIPSMGIKVDALPGRLNQAFFTSKRIGLFTGQCSEICGANHSFMPILTKVSSMKNFIKTLNTD